MKKILISFLMLAIAGCVQQVPSEAEKPQKKLEETEYVKKIDESKDWIVINEIHYSDMGYAYSEMKQMIIDSEYTSGNEFENWYNTIITYTPEIQDFTININSSDSTVINNWIQEQVNLKLTDPKTRGEHVFKVKSFVNEKVISVVIRSCLFLPAVAWESQTYIYNFDITTGKTVKNDELIERFDLDNLQIKNILKRTFDENNEVACDYPKNQQSCYNWQDNNVNDINQNYIFIADSQLNILWQCHDEQGIEYYKQIILE